MFQFMLDVANAGYNKLSWFVSEIYLFRLKESKQHCSLKIEISKHFKNEIFLCESFFSWTKCFFLKIY